MLENSVQLKNLQLFLSPLLPQVLKFDLLLKLKKVNEMILFKTFQVFGLFSEHIFHI